MRLLLCLALFVCLVVSSGVLKASRTARMDSLDPFVVDQAKPLGKKREHQIPVHDAPVSDQVHPEFRAHVTTLEAGEVISGVGFQRVAPPDTDGAAGTTHYVQATNGQDGTVVLFKELATGETSGPYRLGDLAPRNHPCSDDAGGDPIVVWDVLSQRWWISEFTSPDEACGWVCHYVSSSPDPNSDYSFYAYKAPAFPDYPHYASNSGSMFFGSVHEFDCETYEFTGTALLAFEREKMLAGQDAKWIYHQLGADYFPMPMPAQNDNPSPGHRSLPTGRYMRSVPQEGYVETFEIEVDWSANETEIKVGKVQTSDLPQKYGIRVSDVPQKGVSKELDALADRDMYGVSMRHFDSHSSMVGCRTVAGENGRAAPLWWRMDLAQGEQEWKVSDSGVITGEGYRWMCSASLDKQGLVTVGYSYSNPSNDTDPYVGIAYQSVSEASPEYVMARGSAAQVWAGRWGDYASLDIDPRDGCTFWFTTEVVDVHNEWATRVGSFKSTTCQ